MVVPPYRKGSPSIGTPGIFLIMRVAGSVGGRLHTAGYADSRCRD
jgi:hypothetical protein